MQTIHEPARDVPVAYEADVCVIGGSCTGVFAAVAAARRGARVALIENNGFFGGTATAALVAVWHTLLDTEYKRQVIGGLTAEILERLDRRGALITTEPNPNRQYVFNPDEMKIELDRMVAESGVRAFLHARFAAVVAKGGRIQAAVIEDKSGRRAIAADCFIDATGDGDVCARAGIKLGRRADLQPPTTVALLNGMDALVGMNPGFSLGKAIFDPRHPNALHNGFVWTSEVVGSGESTMVAGTRVHNANCADADELTAAEIEGRRQVRDICDILRDNFRGGERVSLARLPTQIGIRETLHPECVYSVSEPDLLTGRRFDDAIANGTYRVDVHHSEKPGITFRYLDGREEYVVPGEPKTLSRWRPETAENPAFYQIPYRALVPLDAKNLLLAGRLIGADRNAYGALRVMVNCNQTGEAAGAAAALALNEGNNVADVDCGRLRKDLAARGAIVI